MIGAVLLVCCPIIQALAPYFLQVADGSQGLSLTVLFMVVIIVTVWPKKSIGDYVS